MRRWTRAAIDHTCGGCGAPIATGQPLLIVTLPGVQRPRYRCVTCDGPAPPDLPGRDMLLFDFKALAAGEREPGEEG